MATSLTLRDGESIKYTTKRSLWSYWLLIILSLFLLSGVVGAFGLIWVYLSWHSTDIVITDQRVLYQTGVFNTDLISLDLPRIESVQVSRSLLGRLANYGTVIVSGAGNPAVSVSDVVAPMVLVHLINKGRNV